MGFDPYDGTAQTKTADITANCTAGQTFGISFSTVPNLGSSYYLVRSGGNVANEYDYLAVIFKNGSTTLTNGVTGISGTGTGSAVSVGTIAGTMAASQSGRLAGSYEKTMSLTITY
jgi:spore coat protein U-like protein